MRPMDREFIEQHDIAQRYLHGRLTPEEAEEFEVYLMDNPEMVAELEIDATLQSSINVSQNTPKQAARFLRWLDYQLVSFAAVASSIVMGFLLFWQSGAPSNLPTGVMTDITVVTLGTSRSSAQPIKKVSKSDLSGSLMLEIQPAAYDEDMFDLVVKRREDGKVIHKVDNVEINNRGDVLLLLPSELLSSGIYDIELLSLCKSNVEVHSVSITN